MSRGYRDEDAEDVARIDDCRCVGATAKAICVEDEGGERWWVPRSVVHDDSEVWDHDEDACGPGVLVVKAWWALKEGRG